MLFLTIVLTILWLALSIKIIGPAEMAVKVYFGTPVAVCDSGFCFVPFTFGLIYLRRYPKKIYNLKYEKIEVITIAGEYPENSGNLYGALKVEVDAAAYLNFPRFNTEIGIGETHPLIKILRAGVPTKDEELKDWTQEAVENALRLAYGQITWRQATMDIKAINKIAAEIFVDSNGVLISAGFRQPGIELVVTRIHLPREVEIALTKPEITRLKAEASKKNAEAQAIDRVETILYTMARSRGVSVDKIRDQIKENPELQRELLDYAKKIHSQLEKADRGAFFEFSAPGKSGIEKGVLDALALFLRGVTGGKGGSGSASTVNPASGEKGGKKKLEDMTDEEKNQAMDDLRKKLEKEKGGG